jgi:rRNA-processing protein FCF1
MKKIAITGVTAQNKMVLSKALFYLTGCEEVRATDYPSLAVKYKLNRELNHCSWQELFVYVLASFSERIEVEQQFDEFISNGSVLNELAIIETIHKVNSQGKRKNKEQLFMLSGLEKIVTEYAARKYDCIIHICNVNSKDTLASDMDYSLINLIKRTEIPTYFIREDTILTDMLEKISSELEVNKMLSPKTALEKAQKEMQKT